MRVSVVFDGRGSDVAIERPTQHTTYSVIYTPAGMTADDLIEQLATQANPSSNVIVATGDGAERDTIEAAGARAVSPEQLSAWLERVERQQGDAIARQQRQTEANWRGGPTR